jgi:hypothetical protein
MLKKLQAWCRARCAPGWQLTAGRCVVVTLVGAALLVGLLTPTAARVGITLTLLTLSALVLCQVCWLVLG